MAFFNRVFGKVVGGLKVESSLEGFRYTGVSPQVADTTYENSTAATNVSTITIPANALTTGSLLHVVGVGQATSTNSTDTLTPKVKVGTTAVITGAALDVADNDLVQVDLWIQVRGEGATGSVITWGKLNTDAGGGTELAAVTTATTVDTTANLEIHLEGTWSVANAGNVFKMYAWNATLC